MKFKDQRSNRILSQSDNGASIRIMTPFDQEILIQNNENKSIGVWNGVKKESKSLGFPIIPTNPDYSGNPLGYYLKNDDYQIRLSQFTDAQTKVNYFTDSTAHQYIRNNPKKDELDNLYVDDRLNFAISNTDTQDKKFDLRNIFGEADAQKMVVFENVELGLTDSLTINVNSDDKPILSNFGKTTKYDLKLEYKSQSEIQLFKSSEISIQEKSGHTLDIRWSEVEDDTLTIYADYDLDHSPNDTLNLVNEDKATAIEDKPTQLPKVFKLHQNYPNPFNPATTIRFSLPNANKVTLTIYNMVGQKVATLVNQQMTAGTYAVNFSAGDLHSGVYIYRIRAGSFAKSKKMILLK